MTLCELTHLIIDLAMELYMECYKSLTAIEEVYHIISRTN